MDTQTSWYSKMTLWQWAILLVAVAAVASIVVYYTLPVSNGEQDDVATDKGASVAETQQPSTDVVASEVTESAKVPAPSKPVAASKLTYDQARAISKYRFQFDNNCNGGTGSANEGVLNVKQGTNIMMENHGDASHVIALGNDARTVAAGDFVVLVAPKVTETTGLYITCDGGGAGNLFVNP